MGHYGISRVTRTYQCVCASEAALIHFVTAGIAHNKKVGPIDTQWSITLSDLYIVIPTAIPLLNKKL